MAAISGISLFFKKNLKTMRKFPETCSLILPAYRQHGYAGKLLQKAIADAKEQGRKGLVLTCKNRLVHYYAKFGFADEGVTDKSTHGNVAWHQMRLTF